MRHELKTDPEAFQAVWNGEKLYEIRKDDRSRVRVGQQPREPDVGFMVYDELLLRETRYSAWEMAEPEAKPLEYTGREVLCRVAHKLSGPIYGLEAGWCIMSIQRLDLIENRYGRKCHFTPQQPPQVQLVEKAFAGLPEAKPQPGISSTSTPTDAELKACGSEGDQYIGKQISDLPKTAAVPHPETGTPYVQLFGRAERPVAEWEKPADTPQRKFGHYFRACPYDGIDVYRVLEIFNVTSPAIQHAIKKLLVPGRRGAKDARKDMSEAVVSINRAIEMMDEDVWHAPHTGDAAKS